MTESSKLEQKKIGLLRYVIERIFCHHTMVEVFRIEVKDSLGYTIGINSLFICEECGKTKDIRI